MNKRAREIGMKDTVFHSVHGLPPGRRQLPDVSTPRDIAKLCRELLKKRDALRYTSTMERAFRTDAAEPFIMRNHNRLLKTMPGCDGLKTGFFQAAGFSIAATAAKNDRRAIAVVFGAKDQKVRDRQAKEILSKGLMQLVMEAPPPPDPERSSETSSSDTIEIKKSTLKAVATGLGSLMVLGVVLFSLKNRTRRNAHWR
jgi:D-alanyl-D-alanine carboxypeptidase (penicillin-binding protein 5/6)